MTEPESIGRGNPDRAAPTLRNLWLWLPSLGAKVNVCSHRRAAPAAGARGEKELPTIPERTQGKRGKIAKSDAHNLWERLKEHEGAVLLFAKDSNVAFTNNRAEQDLRMAKVKQKVSSCFRNSQYADAYCCISSYLQTMANKGHNSLIATQMVLAGEIGRE